MPWGWRQAILLRQRVPADYDSGDSYSCARLTRSSGILMMAVAGTTCGNLNRCDFHDLVLKSLARQWCHACCDSINRFFVDDGPCIGLEGADPLPSSYWPGQAVAPCPQTVCALPFRPPVRQEGQQPCPSMNTSVETAVAISKRLSTGPPAP